MNSALSFNYNVGGVMGLPHETLEGCTVTVAEFNFFGCSFRLYEEWVYAGNAVKTVFSWVAIQLTEIPRIGNVLW